MRSLNVVEGVIDSYERLTAVLGNGSGPYTSQESLVLFSKSGPESLGGGSHEPSR